MAGIVFPDIGNALLPLIQMDRQRERDERQSTMHAQERADNLAFRKEESQYKRDSLDEQKALRLQSHIATMDEKSRAKLKDFSEFRSRGGMAVLGAPPEQQEQAYGMFLQEAKARGYDMSLFPQQWDSSTASRLQFDVEQARPFADHFSQPQAMPSVGGAPGGAPATVSPDATKTGNQHVSYLTGKHGLSPVAAGGVVGGLFQESGFDPGYGFTRPGGDNGTAFGMGQWRLDRAQGLQQFAQQQGKPPTDPNVQLDYLVGEMKGGDMGAQRAYALLQRAKTPEEATVAMMHFFRPAGYTPGNPQAGHGFQQRVQYAQRFANPSDVGAVAGNPAPMPGAPAGLVPPGPPPAAMPSGPQFAQAGGAPVIPQGDAGGTGQGDVRTPSGAPPQQEHQPLRQWLHQAYPGAAPFRLKDGNLQRDSRGYLRVKFADGSEDYVPDPELQAKQRQDQEKSRLEQDKSGRDATKQNTEQANKLRDDFRMEPVVKAYRVVVPMLESAKEAGPTRAGDVNLMYAYAKIMDPESVVRESETGMVTATGTVGDRLQGYVNQLNGGQMLQPETRRKLIAELDSRFRALDASYQEIANAYGEIADSNGVKRSHVILPIRKPKTAEAPAPGGVGLPSLSDIDAELQRRSMGKKP